MTPLEEAAVAFRSAEAAAQLARDAREQASRIHQEHVREVLRLEAVVAHARSRLEQAARYTEVSA